MTKKSYNLFPDLVAPSLHSESDSLLFRGYFFMKNTSYFERILKIQDFVTQSDFDKIKLLLDKLSMPEPNSGCRLWLGDSVKGGYGRCQVRGKKFLAHRLSYFVYKGIIPDGYTVDHLCNNPQCINPLHLEAKTQKENNLRADSFSTINAAKTHCPVGHEFTEQNTFRYKDGRRGCRICIKEKGKVRYNKIKLPKI